MGSYKQMVFLYKYKRQRAAMQNFAHWGGLSQEAAAERWCKNCARYWAEANL